ncbi:MAG: methyltransferase domain-containing protein [Magnetococcales bacterium]|nr:methyltransferase domain-containing protein [Magnetococcales bacterium]
MGGMLVRLFVRLPRPWRERLCGLLAEGLEEEHLRGLLGRLIEARAARLSSDEALRFLFRLDGRLYKVQGGQAVRHGGGLHPKHRLMAYHDFFIQRLVPGERVLDVGCGNGALTCDMAERGRCRVVGIELEADKVEEARRLRPHPEVTYHVGDATSDGEVGGPFDVVTLSNVLEHLSGRPDFLRRLTARSGARRMLIRVPLFERDWRVALKRELGVEWRLDATHETEYTLESFDEEMRAAGLTITHLEVRWGEIWAETQPSPGVSDEVRP